MAGERDRWHLGLEGFWQPMTGSASPVRLLLDARYEGIQDRLPDGTRITGSGDLVLGTFAGISNGGAGLRWTAGVGWRAKLPNAADDAELGTDETDILPSLGVALGGRSWQVQGEGGLAILGNPLRYASQDDVPFGLGRVEWQPTALPWDVGAGLAWAFATSRNPARGEVLARASVQGPERRGVASRFLVEAGAGLTPAAPDLRLVLGIQAGDPGRP